MCPRPQEFMEVYFLDTGPTHVRYVSSDNLKNKANLPEHCPFPATGEKEVEPF